MKTTSYNPSKLEKEFADILTQLKAEIEEKLSDNVIESIKADTTKDNPDVRVKLVDVDGDKHELVIKLIQRPDQDL